MVITIRYASIRDFDISNGEGIGISLFVQGCHFNCPGCFNPETHDFNGGKAWTDSVLNRFLRLIERPYIKRVTILGGEALADENVSVVLRLVKQIRLLFGNKKNIWIYTGYTWGQIMAPVITGDFNPNRDKIIRDRAEIVKMADVLVDGRFEKDKADLTYPYAGSTNQRVIDVQKSLEEGEIVLWR